MATPAELTTPESTEVEPLSTERGNTTIADQVVHKIVTVACREVPGCYPTEGPDAITVQKGERQTAVDLKVVVDYGVSIVETSQALRRTVIDAVEHGTGLEVTEVNISVTDVRLPGGSHPVRPPVPRLA